MIQKLNKIKKNIEITNILKVKKLSELHDLKNSCDNIY